MTKSADKARHDFTEAVRGISKLETDAQALAKLKKAMKPEADNPRGLAPYERTWESMTEAFLDERHKLAEFEGRVPA